MNLLKKIKTKLTSNIKQKLVLKLIEELSELQKELLKGRFNNSLQEIGDVKALLKMYNIIFDCKNEVKNNTKKSFEKWKYLIK